MTEVLFRFHIFRLYRTCHSFDYHYDWVVVKLRAYEYMVRCGHCRTYRSVMDVEQAPRGREKHTGYTILSHFISIFFRVS